MTAFLDFLREYARRVRETEESALNLLHDRNDESGYREGMRQKAALLAGLHDQAAPFLADLPADRRAAVEDRLRAFSGSARNSLDIGSVFYMLALLYPENHQPGQPNDLEIWLAGLEKGA